MDVRATVTVLFVGIWTASAWAQPPESRPVSPPSPLWSLRQPKVVAQEALESGTLVTLRLQLDDPEGAMGRIFVTPQSPFVIAKRGTLIFWSAWMNASPQDNQPALWRALTPASIEIEIKTRKEGEKVINTRAIQKTNVSLRKVSSNRDIHYIDDNTAEISLYFEVAPQDIADVGLVVYKDACTAECRAKGVEVTVLKNWKRPQRDK